MSGFGTLTSPLDLATAMANGHRWISEGDAVYLRGGTYDGDFTSLLVGSDRSPIVIRPYRNEVVKINGSLYFKAPHVTLRGVEIADMDFTGRTSEEGGSAPTDIPIRDGSRIESQATDIKIINCIFHDCRQGMLKGSSNVNVEIYGCVIFYNGWVDSQRGHGHGVYAANDLDSTLLIKDCIIFDNFGWGIHCYGSPPADLRNITIEGCTVFGAGEILGNRAYTNILAGGVSGTVPRDTVLRDNYTYFRQSIGTGVYMGQGMGGSSGLQMYDNVIVGGRHALFMEHYGWGIAPILEGNTFDATVFMSLNEPETDYPNNTYGSGVPDLSFVRANAYDRNRANLTIYNGSEADTVQVDVSAAFDAGDSITARNVQDYWTDTQALTVAQDGTITVNMQAVNRSVATPVGWTAPSTTFPAFGVFVLERA